MPSLNEQELITALAAWVGKLKDPYSKARSAPIPPVTLQSSSPNAWLEIKQVNKDRLEVTCIHRVIEQDDDNNLEEIRRECAQFNSLMERVRLPVYIWEDRDKSEFQLRWQETMLTQADLDSNAGGDGVLINTAAADTNETPVFTDSEGVNVVYQPIIDLTKYVSVDNGSSWVDANGPTGPLLSSSTGFDPKFKYTVTNSGNITLADVTLTDAVYDLNGAEAGTAYSFGTLAVGASMDFIFTQAAWAAGQQSGDATVTVAGMPSVLDIDNAYYLGV